MAVSDEARRTLGEAALAVVGWGYLAYAYTLRSAALVHPVACPWRLLTGTPCPLCGTTRSWDALLHGDVAAAFAFHPVAPLLLPLWAAAALALTVRAVPACHARRDRHGSPGGRGWRL